MRLFVIFLIIDLFIKKLLSSLCIENLNMKKPNGHTSFYYFFYFWGSKTGVLYV